MLLNTLENKKIKKIYLRPVFFKWVFWFYWAVVLMSTLYNTECCVNTSRLCAFIPITNTRPVGMGFP